MPVSQKRPMVKRPMPVKRPFVGFRPWQPQLGPTTRPAVLAYSRRKCAIFGRSPLVGPVSPPRPRDRYSDPVSGALCLHLDINIIRVVTAKRMAAPLQLLVQIIQEEVGQKRRQDQMHRLLDETVQGCGDSKLAFPLASWLVDLYLQHSLRLVARMRFRLKEPALCLRLPSDSASRRTPLPSG